MLSAIVFLPAVGGVLVGDLFPLRFHHRCWPDTSQQLGGLSGHHFLTQSAGDQRSEHGVEPGGGLGL